MDADMMDALAKVHQGVEAWISAHFVGAPAQDRTLDNIKAAAQCFAPDGCMVELVNLRFEDGEVVWDETRIIGG